MGSGSDLGMVLGTQVSGIPGFRLGLCWSGLGFRLEAEERKKKKDVNH